MFQTLWWSSRRWGTTRCDRGGGCKPSTAGSARHAGHTRQRVVGSLAVANFDHLLERLGKLLEPSVLVVCKLDSVVFDIVVVEATAGVTVVVAAPLNRAAPGQTGVLLSDMESLKPQIGHNNGFQAPNQVPIAWALRRTYHTARVGWHMAEMCVRDGPT